MAGLLALTEGSATATDDESPRPTVCETAPTVDEGSGDTYTVRLNTEPFRHQRRGNAVGPSIPTAALMLKYAKRDQR